MVVKVRGICQFCRFTVHFLNFDAIKRCVLEFPVDTAVSLHKSVNLNKFYGWRTLDFDSSTGLAFVFQSFSYYARGLLVSEELKENHYVRQRGLAPKQDFHYM